MFKLTLKVEYALKALVRLGIEGKPLNVSQISRLEHIPSSFLEQILVRLRRAGLVRSIRGKKGGYVLAIPPTEINVLQVIEAVEGRYGLVKCMVPGSEKECMVPVMSCVLRSVWNRLQDRIVEILSTITVQDIMEEALPKEGFVKKRKVGVP